MYFYPLVRVTLGYLASLFEDASILKKTYGLENTEEIPAGTTGSQDNALNLPIQDVITADLAAFHVRSTSVQQSSTKSRRFKWAIRDSSRFKNLVKDIREINNSLESVLELGRKSRLNRQVLQRLLDTDFPDGLALLRDSLGGTPFRDISATAEVKRTTIVASAEAHQASRPSPAQGRSYPMAMDFELDLESLEDPPLDNVRCCRNYRHSGSVLPVKVVLEWKEYGRNIRTRDESILSINLYRLAACLGASSESFHTLSLLGYVRDAEPRLGNPRVGLLYKYPSVMGDLTEPLSLLHRIRPHNAARTTEPPPLGSRFELAQKLATAVYHLLASSWLHKGIRSHNILFFQKTSLDHPYIVGFDHSRPDDPKEASMRFDATLEFDRYRHPEYLHNESQRYRKRYDIYALGVVLMEIGFWITAEDMDRNMRRQLRGSNITVETFAVTLKRSYIKDLASRVGNIYMEAVRACMDYADHVQETELQTWFSEKVLSPLETCKA